MKVGNGQERQCAKATCPSSSSFLLSISSFLSPILFPSSPVPQQEKRDQALLLRSAGGHREGSAVFDIGREEMVGGAAARAVEVRKCFCVWKVCPAQRRRVHERRAWVWGGAVEKGEKRRGGRRVVL